jgi:hypothetical protein
MKIGFGFAIMALAAFLAAPALADVPQRCSLAESCHGDGLGGPHGWMLLVDDATRDNFQNMTIAEIEALKEQKSLELLNMTPTQIEDLRQQKMKERDNMTIAELKDAMPKAQGRERLGGKCPAGEGSEKIGPELCQDNRRGIGPGPNMAHPFLLMDNLTEDELKNMTLAEIKELEQKKMEELSNMTLAEIEKLWQQKRNELDNTTLRELKDRRGHPGRMDGPGMGFGPEMWPLEKAEGPVPGPGK